MPELPEVETVVRTLQPRCVGGTIVHVNLQRTDILNPTGTDLPTLLLGRTITRIERRGKRIMFTLDSADHFYIHLGMSGRLTLESFDAPLQSHTHLILEIAPTSDYSQQTFHMRFRDPRRFGGIWWIGQDTSNDDRMGPEPLSLRTKSLSDKLSKTRRAIKSALLDQSLIAGLGNIYVDESLFAAAIHPLTPADQLDAPQIAALNRAIKKTLKKAIDHRGSTLRDYRDANGASGGFQLRHNVYAREDKPCRVCKTKIVRIVLGGRSTHYCPKCQAGNPCE